MIEIEIIRDGMKIIRDKITENKDTKERLLQDGTEIIKYQIKIIGNE